MVMVMVIVIVIEMVSVTVMGVGDNDGNSPCNTHNFSLIHDCLSMLICILHRVVPTLCAPPLVPDRTHTHTPHKHTKSVCV
jgi:hypothetical protein